MKNQQIADIFNRMGLLNEMLGENVFKVRAYYRAAETISGIGEDVETLKNENRLGDLPGIGQALREKIGEFLETGRVGAYEKLLEQIPESILQIVEIPSVGPKKAKLFFDRLKIKNVEDLRQAAESGKLLGLPGVKDKTVENILKGIAVLKQGQERMDLGTATSVAEEFIAALKALPQVKKISPAGSLRRGRESVRDIDILIDTNDPRRVMEHFVSLPAVQSVSAHGETKSSVLTRANVQVDLRVVEPGSFGAALLYFTGDKNFNVRLRGLAKARGMKVNEYGIFTVGKAGRERLVAGRTEEECFEVFGLPYIPPELREDLGAERIFPAGNTFTVPPLVEVKDIRGDLHVHSNWSDGQAPLAKMAEAARRKGHRYMASTDHSLRLKVAGGLSLDDLKRKKAEIDRLNAGFKDFRVLFGTEAEIDAAGNVDYPEEVLAEFDLVIAAVHTHFHLSREEQTQRLVRACRHPYVDIIAHPTGVQAGRREPYELDLPAVFAAAAQTGTLLEISAFPLRLDLNSANAYLAKTRGVRFVINTDSHRPEHLDYLRFGVTIARRAWLGPHDIANTLPLKQFLKSIKRGKA